MKALKAQDADADFQFWGGDLMEAQGGTLLKHYRDLAFMGFWEVLINLFTILVNFKSCKRSILEYNPHVVILVDYPGFNLRMAAWAKKRSLKVFYYISPQVWAWKPKRVHQIKKAVDRMFVILPFEREFYAGYDYDVDFVGHPLLDAVGDRKQEVEAGEKSIIALVPGSREQEISRMLPVMLSLQNDYPNHKFVVAGVSTVNRDIYEQHLKLGADFAIQFDNLEGILRSADVALVTSGTATLQTALLKIPLVVCYKGSFFSYIIAKQLIKTKYISLVNLIMDREVVAELIQSDFNREMLKRELDGLLKGERRKKMLQDFKLLNEKLGGPGASSKTAELMLGYLKGR